MRSSGKVGSLIRRFASGSDGEPAFRGSEHTTRGSNALFLVEIDDLDAVAIGVVEIGVSAGERGVALIGA